MIRIGLIGCGAIGNVLAKAIDKDKDFELVYIFDLKKEKCEDLASKLSKRPKIAKSLEEMFDCDLIIEAASQEAVREYSLRILDHSDLMIMSVGALRDERLFSKIEEKARNRRVYIPSGAIAGVDGVKSAGIGKINEVVLTSTKSIEGLEGEPYVREKHINLKEIRKPTLIFEGSAKEAAKFFPRIINVSITLSLAGIGTEKTKVRIIADPFAKINKHEIEVKGEFGRLRTVTENVLCPDNRKTSYLAALSAIRTLKKIKENILIGT
jgi:aspartate dehydrogenase